jgi:RNA polymerase primary sigma factor
MATYSDHGEKNLTRYLNDISTLSLIKPHEEVLLAKRIKNDDREALAKLVTANLRFVITIAKNYKNQGLSLNDLINEGNLGLIQAAQRFDETRGYKFISYAVWWIRQHIVQAIQENSRLIRLPQNKINDISKLHRTHGRLEQELEREPTGNEIAEELNISPKEIFDLVETASRTISLDAPMKNTSNAILMEMIVDPESESSDSRLNKESLQKELDLVFKSLNKREEEILKFYYGINCGHAHTLAEISHKFSITRERVRQIKERALIKLRHKSRSKNLLAYCMDS